MNCPKCKEIIESGAAFCGNCGQAVGTPSQAATTLPAYALPNPVQQASYLKSVLALLLGVAGIAGTIFMPFFGLMLGTLGLAVATTAQGRKTGVWRAGLVFAGLAIAGGLGMWAHNVQSAPGFNNKLASAEGSDQQSTQTASSTTTACYSLSFVDQLRVDHAAGCNLMAYNGADLESSSTAYKIHASKSELTTAHNFMSEAKQAIEKDIRQNLPSFKIDRQRVGSFAGSPAYIVNLSDEKAGIAMVEAAVLHQSAREENVFVLVHAANGTQADLQILESEWRWK